MTPIALSAWAILVAAVEVLVAWSAMRSAGLAHANALLVAGIAPALVLVDAPLGRVAPTMRLAVNGAGCLAPLAVALVVLAAERARWRSLLVLVAGAALAAFERSDARAATGVYLDFVGTSVLVAFAAAVLFFPRRGSAGAVGFAAGALGAVIGADGLRTRELLDGHAASTITLGGAGLLDGILLTAILSCALSELLAAGFRLAMREAPRMFARKANSHERPS